MMNNNNNNQNLDPINKCKELMPQFKQNLANLMQQLTLILNPSIDNSNPNLDTNQFQLLGKYIETFNRICDALVVNLRVACEIYQLQSLSNSFERAAYHPANQDPKVQLNRIVEIRNVLQRYINSTKPQTE